MTQLTQDEAELEEFQDKITPMAEKMKDLQKLTELTVQMSETIHLHQ